MTKYGKYEFDENQNKDFYMFDLAVSIYLERVNDVERFCGEDSTTLPEHQDLFKHQLKKLEEDLIQLKAKLTDEVANDFLMEKKKFCMRMQKKPNVQLALDARFFTKDENIIKRVAKRQIASIEAVQEFFSAAAAADNADNLENEPS